MCLSTQGQKKKEDNLPNDFKFCFCLLNTKIEWLFFAFTLRSIYYLIFHEIVFKNL